MEEWTSGVKTAIAAVILVIIIGIVMLYLHMGYASSESSQDTLSGQLSSLSEKMFMPYNQRTVTGADVLAAVEQFRGLDVSVLVNNYTEEPYTVIGSALSDDNGWGYDATYHYLYNGGKLIYNDRASILYDKTYMTYVNPTSKYHSVICRDKAGTILGICFYIK